MMQCPEKTSKIPLHGPGRRRALLDSRHTDAAGGGNGAKPGGGAQVPTERGPTSEALSAAAIAALGGLPVAPLAAAAPSAAAAAALGGSPVAPLAAAARAAKGAAAALPPAGA